MVWTREQVLNLIQLIEKNPILYDYTSNNYKNRELSEKAWNTISSVLKMSKSSVKIKWNIMRTNKRKLWLYYKKKSGRSSDSLPIKWEYYKPMEFLEKYFEKFQSRTFFSTIVDENIMEEDDEYLPSKNLEVENTHPTITRKKIKHSSSTESMDKQSSFSESTITFPNNINSNDKVQGDVFNLNTIFNSTKTKSGNEYFFMDFMSQLEQLKPSSQLEVKIECQKVLLAKILEEEAREH